MRDTRRMGVGPSPSSSREEPSTSCRGAERSQHRAQTRLTPTFNKCSEHGQTHATTNWKNHVAFSTAITRPRTHWKLFIGSGLLTRMVSCWSLDTCVGRQYNCMDCVMHRVHSTIAWISCGVLVSWCVVDGQCDHMEVQQLHGFHAITWPTVLRVAHLFPRAI